MSFTQKIEVKTNGQKLSEKTQMRGVPIGLVVWTVVAGGAAVADAVDMQVNGLTWTMCYAPDYERMANKINNTKEKKLAKF